MKRNPINVNSVAKPLKVLELSKYMKEFTEVRKAMNVTCVVKSSIISVPSNHRRDTICM